MSTARATNALYVDDSPSSIINGRLFSGEEQIVFDLEVQKDIYTVPGSLSDPLEDYFKNSSFADSLQKIICNNRVFLTGSIAKLKSEMIVWGGLQDVRKNLLDNDYSDIMTIVSYEAVPGIHSVTVKVSGESDISSMRNIDESVLDELDIEIVTDFVVVYAQPKNLGAA